MSSQLWSNLAGQTLTLTGADLLALSLVTMSVAVIVVVGVTRVRRVELAHTRFADILNVQLERIGDTLDRIVSQNTVLIETLNERASDVSAMRPQSKIEKTSIRDQQCGATTTELIVDERHPLSEPVRSVISMLKSSTPPQHDVTNS